MLMSSSTATSVSSHLELKLSSFQAQFDDEAITEIAINPDNSVWVELAGSSHMERIDKEVTTDFIIDLSDDLAGESDQPISSHTPIASSEFIYKDCLWRAQVVINPVIEGSAAISLRRVVINDKYDLKFLTDSIALQKVSTTDEVTRCHKMIEDEKLEEFFRHIVLNRWNILISGGTGSGKTTWLRAMLGAANINDRIVTIENAFEVQPKQPNHVCMRMSEKYSSQVLLKSAMRMRPDRVILGELRGSEAKDFLSAINSGHPGGLSTIHSESANAAIEKLATYVMEAGTTLTVADVKNMCANYIDCVVQINRDHITGERKMTEIEILRK